MKTSRDILLGAKKAIETLGWTQGKLQDDATRCVCLVGALRVGCTGASKAVLGIAVDDLAAFDLAWGAVNAAALAGHRLSTWNDTPGRTKEEVLAVLDKAIEQVAAA